MIFFTAVNTYYAKTTDNKFYKLGFHDYTSTEWFSGAWEDEYTSEFFSHKGKYIIDATSSYTEGEYVAKFTEDNLRDFLRNHKSQEIRTVLDWAGLHPEQIDTFYLHHDGEDAGYPFDPSWWEITAKKVFKLKPDKNGDLPASLPDELRNLIKPD